MLTLNQRLDSRAIVTEQLQTEINEAVNLDHDLAKAKQLAQFVAMASHADYPQYHNHWNDWQLVMLTHNVTTKAGTAFKTGDFALAKPKTSRNQTFTLFSVRNLAATSVMQHHVDDGSRFGTMMWWWRNPNM